MRKVLFVKSSPNTLVIKRDCYNTTIQQFIDAVVHDKWPYSKEDLENVIGEYVELMRDAKKDTLLTLQKEVTRLNNKLQITSILLESLNMGYYPDACDELKRMGYRVNYSEATLAADIQKTITFMKGIAMQRDESLTRLNNMRGSNEKTTEADFDNILVDLSKFQGYRITKDVYLSEYIAIKNAYTADIEAKLKEHGSRVNR